MYYRITNTIKKILIQELQDFFKDHPVFNGELVITNKFSLDERPKYAIILKTATARSEKLGLDNFKGMVQSYVTLANFKNQPGRMIEWVREDLQNVANLVKPGYYVVRMIDDSHYTVTAYLTVADEELEIQQSGFKFAMLKNQNINPGSEWLVTETGRKLQKDQHYTIDYVTGEVIILKMPDDSESIAADYQYIGDTTGPYEVKPETASNVAIPGVTLAFGNFLKAGGVQVVIVYPERQDVAKAYMGKWVMTISLSAVAQDTDTQEQLVDLASMYIWSVLQEKLVDQGIYIDNFNMGGESEDEEVQTSNEMSFTADLSFDVNVEWEAYQPVLGVIKRVFMQRVEDFGQYDDAEYATRIGRPLDGSQRGVDYKLGLQPVESFDPYLVRPLPKYTLLGSSTRL